MSDAASDAARRLAAWGERHEWVGTDPYDGLNATRLTTLAKRSVRGRQALIQAVKRSPFDLRPLLGVPPAPSAATMAHVISAYAAYDVAGNGDRRNAAMARAIERQIELRSPGYDEPCWGYHFDVQTRVFFYPRDSPNTIATAFAGLALLDAHEVTGEERLLELASGVADFFVRHVPQTPGDGEGAFFGYLDGDRTPIHNASMLVAAVLARVAAATGRGELRAPAAEAARYTATRQRPDGSWPYGEMSHLGWVDNFHTGYVLDCLRTCADHGIAEAREDVIDRGLELYRCALFAPDGTPRYSTTSTYPIDGQCVAQAINTFAVASARRPALLADAERVLAFALRRMQRGDGAFLFQRRRLWRNATPHLRWVQAPMLAALARLARAQEATAR